MYDASKSAVIGLTRGLARELSSRGIRVNAVSPGLIETEMIQSIPQIQEMVKRIPLGRLGTAEEVAKAIAFLCSDAASYVTGQTLVADGGLVMY